MLLPKDMMAFGMPHMIKKQVLMFNAHTLQFADEATSGGGGLLVWADLTKMGRMSSNDLNYVVDTMATALSKRPTNSIGFIVAPWLSSERIVNAQRGERRSLDSSSILF